MKQCKDDSKSQLDAKLTLIENQISENVAEENRSKIKEHFQKLSNPDGLLNTNGMWSIKRKMFPKNRETLPFAKQDFDGKLITSQESLKTLYLETFEHRLRSRLMKVDLQWLRKLKEELCSDRIKLAKLSKTPPWSQDDLHQV